MKQQMAFDFKKMMNDKIYIVITLLLITVSLMPLISFSDSDSDTYIYNEIKNEIAITEIGLKQMEEDNAIAAVKDETERLDLLNTYLYSMDENEPYKELAAKLDYEKKILNQMESGSRVGVPIIDQQKTVAELSYLKNNNLLPLDNFSKSTPGINYISMILQGFLPFTILLILPALTYSNVFSMEKEKGTKDFLNMVPVAYKTIITSKMIVASIFSFFCFIFTLLVTFIIVSIKNGIGILNYPISRSRNGLDVEILTTSNFLGKALLLILFIFIFLCCLAFLVSRFTDNLFIQLFVLLACISIPSTPIFSPESAIASFAHYLPFTYFDFNKVLTYGNSYTPVINEHISFLSGITILSIYSIICIIFSSIIIRKRKKI